MVNISTKTNVIIPIFTEFVNDNVQNGCLDDSRQSIGNSGRHNVFDGSLPGMAG